MLINESISRLVNKIIHLIDCFAETNRERQFFYLNSNRQLVLIKAKRTLRDRKSQHVEDHHTSVVA